MTDLLDITPSQDGYSLSDSVSGVLTSLKGGVGRSRMDLFNTSYLVNVTWKLNRTRYETLAAFHNTHQGEPFLMDLVVDSPFLTRHEVAFLPGTFRLDSISGATYGVSAALEVVPIPAVEADDERIMFLFETYGGDPGTDALPNALERLVNVVMPENMG
jgi:hypothetical protein